MSSSPTVVPPGTRIIGLIESAGDLVIEGRCEGELRIGGTLTVATKGVCAASVRARVALIHGDVIGNLICSDRVTVSAGAHVVGDIRAPDVSIDAAGELDGTVDMLPPDPESIPLSRTRARTRGEGLVRPTPPPRSSVSS